MIKRRLALGGMATLTALFLAVFLLWLGSAAAAPTPPTPITRYVATDGIDSGDCSTVGGRCASVQYAVDQANPGDEIHVAHGTYAPGGIVAAIVKSLTIRGAYQPGTFAGPDPDMYQTVLDAQWGGSVISATYAGEVTLQHLTLTHGDGSGNCGSDGCGGGIYAAYTTLHVGQCTITDNKANTSPAGYGYGGGIYAKANGCVVNVWESRIEGNVANTSPLTLYYSAGGGIYVYQGEVALAANQVLDNVGSQVGSAEGGGITLKSVMHADVLTNTIRGNVGGAGAWNAEGGGLHVSFSTSAYVAGNHIEDNHAGNVHGGGGGVYIAYTTAHLARNTVVSNTTGTSGGQSPGGGVCIGGTDPVTLSNNLIAGNRAYPSLGGAVYASSFVAPPSEVSFFNNTIANNGDTGVAARWYTVLTLTNNIVAGHDVGLGVVFPFTGTITADTNLFWDTSDPITGTGAIQEDPLLGSSYRLRDGSPAEDAGVTISWLTKDLDGRQRPVGAAYDLGAFEGVWKEVFLPLVLRSYQ